MVDVLVIKMPKSEHNNKAAFNADNAERCLIVNHRGIIDIFLKIGKVIILHVTCDIDEGGSQTLC